MVFQLLNGYLNEMLLLEKRVLLVEMEASAPAAQLGLFELSAVAEVDRGRLVDLFSEANARRLAETPLGQQRACVERRLARLDKATRLCVEKTQRLRSGLRHRESVVAAEARLVLATMTNVYMSSLMAGQRFDAVIVEEAGMAILPTLFYCSCLGEQRAIMVGDPQQLPPIVQSSEPFVQRAMAGSGHHQASGTARRPGFPGEGAQLRASQPVDGGGA